MAEYSLERHIADTKHVIMDSVNGTDDTVRGYYKILLGVVLKHNPDVFDAIRSDSDVKNPEIPIDSSLHAQNDNLQSVDFSPSAQNDNSTQNDNEEIEDEEFSELIISEVYYDGTDEWIEIYNIGNKDFS